MRLDTHLPASSSLSKAARTIADLLGLGATFRVTSVMMPRVPSLPTNSRSSWYPEEFLMVLVPTWMIEPSARTTSSPST